MSEYKNTTERHSIEPDGCETLQELIDKLSELQKRADVITAQDVVWRVDYHGLVVSWNRRETHDEYRIRLKEDEEYNEAEKEDDAKRVDILAKKHGWKAIK